MTVRVLDVETTGFDAANDHIIEIASIDLEQEHGYTNAMETMVALPEGCTIPPEISGITHIIDEDLVNALPRSDAFDKFVGADYYVAHNAAFDSQWFPTAYKNWICTMKCAAYTFPDAPNYKNQTLRYYLGLAQPFGIRRQSIDPHRALSDVLVTAAIFYEIQKRMGFRKMVEVSKQPMIIRKFTFGKHKGQRLTEVPADYLNWIKSANDIDPDLKWNVQNELQRRSNG